MITYAYIIFGFASGVFIANMGTKIGNNYGVVYEIVADLIGIVIWIGMACFFVYRKPKVEKKTKENHIRIQDRDLQKYFDMMDIIDKYNGGLGKASYYSENGTILLDGVIYSSNKAIKKIKKALKDVDKATQV